jgi:uncharacterized protein (DUF1778 family)
MKNKNINIRVSEEEMNIITELAKKNNMTVSELLLNPIKLLILQEKSKIIFK